MISHWNSLSFLLDFIMLFLPLLEDALVSQEKVTYKIVETPLNE